ncbi:MAG: nitroreductase family protein, partial [Clostridia bacterium]|nr:nitroreductase family protein [Clostridia bacterium]
MLLDLVKKARSYRRYDPTRSIPEDEIRELVEAARLTPSAGNLQRLRYLALTKKDEVQTLTKEVKWAGYLTDWDGPSDAEAPAAYLILLSPESTGVSQIDVGIAAETILLAAAEAGFGGCLIGAFREDEVAPFLRLPKKLKPIVLIALGVPDEVVIICDLPASGSTKYYRDKAN